MHAELKYVLSITSSLEQSLAIVISVSCYLQHYLFLSIKMSILLLNDKNEDKLLLKKKVKNKTELEIAITDSTSNLPLGKALNLLVHIHSRVFDKAIATIRESSPSELTVHIIECKIQTHALRYIY